MHEMFISIHSHHFCTLWMITALSISCTGKVVFELPEDAKPLGHIVVDNKTGNVFLGANDYTFKLDQNLNELEVTSDLTKSGSNKVLLISGDDVVDCRANATHATCFKRDLNNIRSFTTSNPTCWPSNSADDDTVSYITEFSIPDFINKRDMVYSASRRCNNEQHPWISVRELDGSNTHTGNQQREYTYNGIFFKGGFSSKNYSYFFTNQERYPPDGNQLVPSGSRVIQLCNSPPVRNSFPYTDMPLVCRDGQTEYKWIQALTVLKVNAGLASNLGINQEDDVLVTAFSSDNGTQYVQSRSAICLFTMEELRDLLNDTRSSCATSKGEGYIPNSQTCQPNPAVKDLVYDFCKVTQIPLIGHLTLTATPVYTTSSVISSLASVVTATATVVLAGTDQGHVQKISLSYPSGSFVYDDDVIDKGHPVISNLLLSPLKDYAFAQTQNKIVRLPLYEGCMENNNNTKCADCIDTGNTLCGWCVLEGRCSSEDDCNGAQQTNHWLRATDDVCVSMSVSRSSIHVGETYLLNITISTMPSRPASISYVCAFDNSVIPTTSPNDNEFQCQIPIKQLSFIPDPDAYRVVTFSMKSSDTSISFVYQDFYYYECSRFTSCFGCTDPRFDCTWCVESNQCTHDVCAAGDTGLTNTQKDLCPQILETDKTLIPNNVSREITVIGSNLPNSDTYKCRLSGPRDVSASWINDTALLCAAHTYTYPDSINEVNPTLTVTWHSGFQIDSKNAIEVTLYKCELLGSDCSSCQAAVLSKPYECSACTDHAKCTYRETSQCGSDMSCPAPTISTIHPNSGPTAGGTTITINGEELGRRVEDIDNVMVHDTECKNITWIGSTRILWSLMSELIDNSVEKKHQKTLLRRSETIAEKYLSNWLTLCLYNYLVDHAGSALFMLYKATMNKMHSGPICAVTGSAKCTLSEQKLLKSQVEFHVVTLNVELNTDIFSCTVLSCDTITQVKDKCLRIIYKNMAASDIPRGNEIDLEWRQGQGGHLILQDIDVTSLREGGCTKLNTLEHYNVQDGSTLALLSNAPLIEDMDMDESVASLASISPLIIAEEKRGSTPWHLMKPETDENENEKSGGLQDIYLNRMVQTKFALKECVDQFFNAVLDANYVPLVVKYLFQYLEREAYEHEVKDPDIIHTWKSNSYPVRFLSQLIMKPEYVFDIHKPETINQCLDVLAQAFNDSLSTSHKLLKGKNKASSIAPSRLVFSGQVESIYKPQVNAMFQILSDGDQVSEQEVMVTMNALSKKSNTHFKKTTALYKIYEYLEKYHEKICDDLSGNTDVRQLNLSEKFERIIKNMNPESLYDN